MIIVNPPILHPLTFGEVIDICLPNPSDYLLFHSTPGFIPISNMVTPAIDLTNTSHKESEYFFREYYSTNSAGRKFYNKSFKYQIEKNDYDCPARILVELLYAEHQFRYQAQLIDGWRERTTNEHSSEHVNEGANLHDSYRGDFPQICQIYIERERTLYLKERELPNLTLAKVYRSVRDDPGWYLGTYPVAECAAMGGCCGRSCGCCVKRLPHLPRRGISGHCSLACACCERTKGCIVDSDRVAAMDEQYNKALESDNPSFLARIANSYFRPTNGKASRALTASGNEFSVGGYSSTGKQERMNASVFADLKGKTDTDFGSQSSGSICAGENNQLCFQTKHKKHLLSKEAAKELKKKLLPPKGRDK